MADQTPTFNSTFDQFQQNRRSQDPSAYFSTSSDPNFVAGNTGGTYSLYSFPADMPLNNFVICEGEFVGVFGNATGGMGNFDNIYQLPLPMKIEDQHNVAYDRAFNFFALGKEAFSGALDAIGNDRRNTRFGRFVRGQNILGGAAATAGRVGAPAYGAARGMALNNLKTITLQAPEFRVFHLEWSLHPKTYDESTAIQAIILNLTRGMLPAKSTQLFVPVFTFPKVYLMYFRTGQNFLFKFKPAVLQSLNVNYQGGASQPAFFKDEAGRAIPHGYFIQTTWLELEQWTRENVKGQGGLGDNDPFSAVVGTRS